MARQGLASEKERLWKNFHGNKREMRMGEIFSLNPGNKIKFVVRIIDFSINMNLFPLVIFYFDENKFMIQNFTFEVFFMLTLCLDFPCILS